jgi:hypothetical protein
MSRELMGLVCAALLGCVAGVAQQEPEGESKEKIPLSKYSVTGTLLKEDKSPIAGVKVYLLDVTRGDSLVTLSGGVQAIQHSVTVSYTQDADGNIVAPSGETDETGQFTIRIPERMVSVSLFLAGSHGSELPELPEVAVCTLENGGIRKLVNAEGKPVTFPPLALDLANPGRNEVIKLREVFLEKQP